MTRDPATVAPRIETLSSALERRELLLSTWRNRYFSAVPAGTRIDAGEFDQIFGLELDRLAAPAATPDAPPATLRETAATLADLGVPLAHLVIAGSAWRDAICEILGPSLEPEVEAAVAELDALRSKTYAEVYAAREAHSACTRPVVSLRRKEDDDAFELVGTSPAMERLREQIPEAAAISGALLLIGEPGSGRELVARSIHTAAGLERSRFFRLSPVSLSPHVVDSELFGHVGRAGATNYPGLLRAAEGGTLFIDELTALSPEVQAKLLHVLERRAVRPVGADQDEPVNVRIIAATSRDLDEAVQSGALRGDLCSRLRDLTVYVPPLRERRSDIPQLCEHFPHHVLPPPMRLHLRHLRSRHATALGGGLAGQRARAPQRRRACGVQRGGWHRARGGLAAVLVARPRQRRKRGPGPAPDLAEAEEQLIRTTLRHFDGNKLRAARSLGISRHKLYDRLRKLGL